MFASYKQMSLNVTDSVSGQNISLGESYSVLYKSATTYKVNVTLAEQGVPQGAFTTWVLTNGTAIAVNLEGQNTTGSGANGLYRLLMIGFSGEIGITAELSSGAFSPYIHQTTKGTATFGPTAMNVVDYAANSLPFSVSACGETQTFTAYSLQTGSVPSSPQPVLTFLNIDMSLQGPLGSGPIDETLQLVSVTLA